MDISPYISSIVAAAIAIVGAYVAMKNANNAKFEALSVQIAKLSQQVDDLRSDVEKHNNLVEKVAVNTRDIKTAWNQIDELKERDNKIEEKIEKMHQ